MAPPDTSYLPRIVIQTIVAVQITLFSLLGNLLICLAFYKNRRLRTITNIYVLSLAVTDITVVSLIYPFCTIASSFRQWPFGYSFCQFNGFLAYSWALVSIGILALTAVNRYFCIVRPKFYRSLFSKKKTVLSIVMVSLFIFSIFPTVVFLSSIFFQWHPYYLFCQLNGEKVQAKKTYFFTFASVFVACPLAAIFFCYGSVYRAIRRHKSSVRPSLQRANSQETVSAQEIQASRVLLAAVIAFCISWIPSTTAMAMEQFTSIPSFFQTFSTFASGSSAWINPIIYGVMNRTMRKEFIRLLRCQQIN